MQRRSVTAHALHLKMCHLEIERQRRIVEIEQAQLHLNRLRQRIEQIDHERVALTAALAEQREPLKSAATLAVSRPMGPVPVLRPQGQAGLAIKY
jgi:hypothetical protein